MDAEELKVLIEQNESQTLDFKREWYWDDATPQQERSKRWGEYIKDLISLSNGYHTNAGEPRYLIIGVQESDKSLHDAFAKPTRFLENLESARLETQRKLENHVKIPPQNLRFHKTRVEEKHILVIEIPSPYHYCELIKELQTKTRTIDRGVVLIRKGQRSDEVRSASPDEIVLLSEAFAESRKLKNNDHKSPHSTPERSIERTVQSYIDKNSAFTIEEGFPKKERDWKNEVIFEIYALIDDFNTKREFIYIHEKSRQSKTLARIKSLGHLKNPDQAIIFTERPEIKEDSKRIDNLKSLFKCEHVYFIDQFGLKYLYKECLLDYKKYNLPLYIESQFESDTFSEGSAYNALKEWYKHPEEPVLVISGHGGIGKTTLAKQFLDYVYDNNKNTGILFIDSREIISELSKAFTTDNKIEDLYDFYNAQMSVIPDSGSSLSRELLKLSLDNGNLVIVLDGIDEVIAKLGNRFNVELFTRSIFNEYSSDIKRAKILITCRDHFWNEVGKNITVPAITLKAFNKELAEEFFVKTFREDKRKSKDAMEIAKKFAIDHENENDEEDVFIPFLLDIIRILLESKEQNLRNLDVFSSPYLCKNNDVDHLIYKVCEREIVKLGNIDTNNQIKFFILLALNANGFCSNYDVKEIISNATDGQPVKDETINNIKGHPFIQANDNGISFRYDVFNLYFKTLFISNFFNNKNADEKDRAHKIICSYLKYDTSFTRSVAERVPYNDDLIIFCIELIESYLPGTTSENAVFVSSVFSLLLTMLKHDPNEQNDVQSRTLLMTKLFERGNQIIGMSIIDVFGSSKGKPTFDFKGRRFSKCSFVNYEYFWDCQMDEITTFSMSKFKDIDPRQGQNISHRAEIFDNTCDTSEISHIFNAIQSQAHDSYTKIKDELVKIFRIFHERGNFYPRKQAQVRKKVFAAKLLPQLLSLGVIKEFTDRKKPTLSQYIVNDSYSSVINLLEQGTDSIELNKLALMISKSPS